MGIKKLGIGSVFLICIGLAGVQAQEVISTAGGDASSSSGSVSYSIGQLVYSSSYGNSGSVAEGVQQPFEISVVSGVETVGIDLTLSVYPNPTTDYLLLKVEGDKLSGLSYQLFDMNGKLLAEKSIADSETHVEVSGLVPATYLLRIAKNGVEVKTFKIIKN